jgi:phage tail sheath protein FI
MNKGQTLLNFEFAKKVGVNVLLNFWGNRIFAYNEDFVQFSFQSHDV